MLTWFQGITPPQDLTTQTLLTYVLIDLCLIIVLARILGNILNRIGQPRVVGEITAGILLGSTLLGKNLSMAIIPEDARIVLSTFAAMGLALFMFLVGVEFDLSKTSGRVGQAGLLAVLAILLPVLLSFPLAGAIFSPEYAGAQATDILPFALFIGAGLCVTAFPILAYILMERGELNSKLGSLGVASAGIMSVIMFGFISVATAVVKANGSRDLIIQFILIIGFITFSWVVLRPFLPRLIAAENHTGNDLAIILGGLTLYAAIAHQLGIHVMVGGFLWGMILPENPEFRSWITSRLKEFSLVFFLPIFSAIAGFQTDLRLLSIRVLPAFSLILIIAIASKFLAVIPARLYGMSWAEVGTLGALFNTRGLLVLVAGLIGLELGIITNLTFTIFTLIALITNLMTAPMLNIFYARQKNPHPSPGMAEI